MRAVGYVREAIGPDQGDSAFAQQEQIRAWARRTGAQLVSICQDTRQPGHALGRDGYFALLGIVAAGRADAVVVASLSALSADVMVQEVMVWDLATRGAALLSVDEADIAELTDPPPHRSIMRDMLARIDEYDALLTRAGELPLRSVPSDESDDGRDVIVHLIPDTRSSQASPG